MYLVTDIYRIMNMLNYRCIKLLMYRIMDMFIYVYVDLLMYSVIDVLNYPCIKLLMYQVIQVPISYQLSTYQTNDMLHCKFVELSRY